MFTNPARQPPEHAEVVCPERPGRVPTTNWRAVRLADSACCCPARPAVVAIVPPGPGRPHPTELLLCGHHFRRSRAALKAVGATVLNPSGLPVTAENAWRAGSDPVPASTR